MEEQQYSLRICSLFSSVVEQNWNILIRIHFQDSANLDPDPTEDPTEDLKTFQKTSIQFRYFKILKAQSKLEKNLKTNILTTETKHVLLKCMTLWKQLSVDLKSIPDFW